MGCVQMNSPYSNGTFYGIFLVLSGGYGPMKWYVILGTKVLLIFYREPNRWESQTVVTIYTPVCKRPMNDLSHLKMSESPPTKSLFMSFQIFVNRLILTILIYYIYV